MLTPEQVAHVKRLAVPRVMLSVDEAAESMGMSRRFFEGEVLFDLRVVRLGNGARRKTYIRVAELEAWAERRASLWVDGPSLNREAVGA